MRYDLSSFMRQCVQTYVELAGARMGSLRKVGTPFLTDDAEIDVGGTEGEPAGQLAPIALRVLMKVLYAPRMGRYDILRARCALAKRVTKWSTACDRRLHRLMCYINATADLCLYAHVGDDLTQCRLALYCDADFAGDKSDSRSTSGVFLAVVGPKTFFPTTAVSKKAGLRLRIHV